MNYPSIKSERGFVFILILLIILVVVIIIAGLWLLSGKNNTSNSYDYDKAKNNDMKKVAIKLYDSYSASPYNGVVDLESSDANHACISPPCEDGSKKNWSGDSDGNGNIIIPIEYLNDWNTFSAPFYYETSTTDDAVFSETTIELDPKSVIGSGVIKIKIINESKEPILNTKVQIMEVAEDQNKKVLIKEVITNNLGNVFIDYDWCVPDLATYLPKYYLFVDGYKDANCDFTSDAIEKNTPVGTRLMIFKR